MLDEIDNLLAGDKELLAAIKATVNSGYKKSGSRSILEPIKGGGWVCKNLSTFCPKILSGISGLPEATKSRCIPIEMERMLPGDRVHDLDEYIHCETCVPAMCSRGWKRFPKRIGPRHRTSCGMNP
jgi:hypothetical protein